MKHDLDLRAHVFPLSRSGVHTFHHLNQSIEKVSRRSILPAMEARVSVPKAEPGTIPSLTLIPPARQNAIGTPYVAKATLCIHQPSWRAIRGMPWQSAVPETAVRANPLFTTDPLFSGTRRDDWLNLTTASDGN